MISRTHSGPYLRILEAKINFTFIQDFTKFEALSKILVSCVPHPVPPGACSNAAAQKRGAKNKTKLRCKTGPQFSNCGT